MKFPPAEIWRFRLIVAVLLAAAVVGWFYVTDPEHGADTALRVQFLAWALVVVGPAYLVRRALLGEARSHVAWRKAMVEKSIPATIAWVALAVVQALIFVSILFATMGSARAADLPPLAKQYLPVLQAEQRAHWPGIVDPVTLGAQVEQETCPSLKSRSCWNTRAELKTCYENGFGLAQITIAYDCKGNTRFDNFAAARGLDPSLRTWAWADRYDPARQLRTLVLMDRNAYNAVTNVPEAHERLAMAFSAYNGGLGGVRADRRLCAQIPDCDPTRWFGNVELHSLKARAARAGYGQSAFAINRGYVQNVMVVRRAHYVGWL